MYSLTILSGIAAIIFFITVRVKKAGIPGLLSKSVASFLFILTACVSLYINPSVSGYGLLIIPGLVCGLIGDIWLDLKYAYPEHADTYLYAGFYSFMAGHIFYIVAIYTTFEWSLPLLTGTLFMAIAASGVIILSGKQLGFMFGKFRVASFIYGSALMMTTFSSFSALYLTGETMWYMMSAAGILFAASDLVLSATYFGQGKNTPPYIILNHVLYYAAQYLIASSIILVK